MSCYKWVGLDLKSSEKIKNEKKSQIWSKLLSSALKDGDISTSLKSNYQWDNTITIKVGHIIEVVTTNPLHNRIYWRDEDGKLNWNISNPMFEQSSPGYKEIINVMIRLVQDLLPWSYAHNCLLLMLSIESRDEQ